MLSLHRQAAAEAEAGDLFRMLRSVTMLLPAASSVPDPLLHVQSAWLPLSPATGSLITAPPEHGRPPSPST